VAERARALVTATAAALVAVGMAAALGFAADRVEPRATQVDAPVDARRTPVIFISLDEFPVAALMRPDGEIDAQRFPNFAALARTSNWFSTTTTVADGTRVATPTLIGGVFPKPGSLPILADYPSNLLALLSRTHRVHAIEPVGRLCPSPACPGRAPLPRRPRRAIAQAIVKLIPQAKKEAKRRSVLAAFIRGLGPWRRGKPPLHYVDVLLPHHPWQWLPSGRRYGESVPAIPGLHGDNLWRANPTLVDAGWQRFLLQVGYTDLLIGRLMRKLARTGLWDRALVVVVPDHGVSFVSGVSRRAVSRATVGGIAPIPFFLKQPGQTLGRRIDTHVQTPDILPTLLDALDVRVPRRIEGRSALSPGFRPSPRVRVWKTTFGFGRASVSFPLEMVKRARQAMVERQAKLFGLGGFGTRFYRIGPYPALIGTRVARARRSGAAVAISGRGPRVFGTVSGLGAGRALAVAVNGRIWATSRTYSERGAVRFAVMVPESALRVGRRIAVYAASGPGRRVRLSQLG
jgi:Sulfatase